MVSAVGEIRSKAGTTKPVPATNAGIRSANPGILWRERAGIGNEGTGKRGRQGGEMGV